MSLFLMSLVIVGVVIMVGLFGDAFSSCTYVSFVDELNLLQKLMSLQRCRLDIDM